MEQKINIDNLDDLQKQALVCMYYAMLPKTDARYKQRMHDWEVLEKRFGTKKTTYSILIIRILENQAKNTNGDHIIYFLDLLCFHHRKTESKTRRNQKSKQNKKGRRNLL